MHRYRYILSFKRLISPCSNQCGSGAVIFFYHLGIYEEDFTVFDTIKVWVFDGTFVLIPFVYISCKNLHT